MIEHLVLSGAATNGLIQVGLLNHLMDTNFFKLKDIKSIYATSAGAIISILILLGVSFTEIKEYFINRPWQKFFDIDFKFEEKGVFLSCYLYDMIKPFIKAYDIPESYTLLDLYNKTSIDLHIFTTKINGMVLTDLNHVTHPSITIQQVITMTAAIPFVFPPVKYENEYYIDGGLVNRCPLRSIEHHNYDPTSILVIDILEDSIVKYNDESSMIDLLIVLYSNSMMIICSDMYNEKFINYPYYYRIISENIFNSNALEKFINTIEYRQELYEKGYNYLKNKTENL